MCHTARETQALAAATHANGFALPRTAIKVNAMLPVVNHQHTHYPNTHTTHTTACMPPLPLVAVVHRDQPLHHGDNGSQGTTGVTKEEGVKAPEAYPIQVVAEVAAALCYHNVVLVCLGAPGKASDASDVALHAGRMSGTSSNCKLHQRLVQSVL